MQCGQPVLELVQVVLLPGRGRRESMESAPRRRRNGAREERIHGKRPEGKKKRGVGGENP